MDVFLGNPPENIRQWIVDDYNRKQEEKKRKIPLCFEAVDAGATIALKCNGDNLKTATFQTSTDGQNWSDYTYETGIPLTNAGDKVYFMAKTDNTAIVRDMSNYLQFMTTQDAKKVKVSGNVMSLLAPDFKDLLDLSTIRSGNPGTHQFYRLFDSCNNVKDCGNLILQATTLTDKCYYRMFYICTSLTKAPALPATTLASYCYGSMFSGCTSLTQAPALRAYTSGLDAYDSMLNMYVYDSMSWGLLTTCIWNDLTISEAESIVLNECIFGDSDIGIDVRISITCKDGSGVAYHDSSKYSWVFEY